MSMQMSMQILVKFRFVPRMISLFLMSLIQMQSLVGNERKTKGKGYVTGMLLLASFQFLFLSVKVVNQRIHCDIKNL